MIMLLDATMFFLTDKELSSLKKHVCNDTLRHLKDSAVIKDYGGKYCDMDYALTLIVKEYKLACKRNEETLIKKFNSLILQGEGSFGICDLREMVSSIRDDRDCPMIEYSFPGELTMSRALVLANRKNERQFGEKEILGVQNLIAAVMRYGLSSPFPCMLKKGVNLVTSEKIREWETLMSGSLLPADAFKIKPGSQSSLPGSAQEL
jgi:hypothetical protein